MRCSEKFYGMVCKLTRFGVPKIVTGCTVRCDKNCHFYAVLLRGFCTAFVLCVEHDMVRLCLKIKHDSGRTVTTALLHH